MRRQMYILLFYLFIFFVVSFFFIFIFNYNLKETMTNNDMIVLIGDSILNNNIYVPLGKSVADNIKLLHGNNVIIGAKDSATIDTCYYQLNNIINSENYHLFISIGGNDILNNSYEKLDKNKNDEFEKIKEKYIELINFIKKKYPKPKIYLFNLYYPTDEKYKKYKNIINQWNKMISSFDKNEFKILKLDEILNKSSDFTHGIEPSTIGSEKIAKLIVES